MDTTRFTYKRIMCGVCALVWLGVFGIPAGGQLSVLDFGDYYEPYDLTVEPNAPGYALPLDTSTLIVAENLYNLFDIEGISDLIGHNGFAIVPGTSIARSADSEDDIVAACKFVKNTNIPLLLTTDTVLHLYHVQFDETLKDIEERQFVGDIGHLTAALLEDAQDLYEQLDGDLKEAAKRNVAYLSVAQKLIDPNATTGTLVADPVTEELAKIYAHQGFAPSEIFIYREDYSQYVPRGHYTRSEALERYFRTMMWYGRMAFLLKGAESWGPMGDALISVYDAKIQTLQAMLLALSLRDVQVGDRMGLEVWDRLYTVTAFYVGLADDLTPYDYLWALDQVFDNDYAIEDLADDDNLFALNLELATLPSPEIYGGTGEIFVDPITVTDESLNGVLGKTKGMRLMGQRFIPDSYMFQKLVYPAVTTYYGDPTKPPFALTAGGLRGYPRGLDVMALLGSDEAMHILIDRGETDFYGYWQQFGALKDEFAQTNDADWNANLYWSWLYSLKALLEDLPEGYPTFMRTDAWQRRSLQAALASWTELRHDTILYAKQSSTVVGVGRPSQHLPPGYVEPVPAFYGRLLTLARMTRLGLSDMEVLTEQATARLTELENLLERLAEISIKELTNEPLSETDYAFIRGVPGSLEYLVLGVGDAGMKTTLVADVHTDTNESRVVEEGVGKIDFIVTACPAADGTVFLAIGPVLSYYEFKHPMSDRLTDEAWREMLDSGHTPDRPQWVAPLLYTGQAEGQ